MTKGKIAGWDNNALTDKTGTAILSRWLTRDPEHRFYPSISDNDKTPNYDGEILYGAPQGDSVIPQKRVAVQVKSTTQLTKDSTGYQVGTEVFEATRARITLDLTALVIVDVENEIAHWYTLTDEFIAGLELDKLKGSKKTIRLEDGYKLDDYDEFYALLSAAGAKNEQRYKIADSGVLTSADVGKKRLAEVQDAYDYFSGRLNSDYYFLKHWGFPHTWNVAISYGERNDLYYLGITPIEKGSDNSISMRRYELADEKSNWGFPFAGNIESAPPLTCSFALETPLKEAIDKSLAYWAKHFMRTQTILPGAMPDVMLAEAFFWFADYIAGYVPGLTDGSPIRMFAYDNMQPSACQRLYDSLIYAGRKFYEGVSIATEAERNGLYLYDPFAKRGRGDKNSPVAVAEYFNEEKTIAEVPSIEICLECNTVPYDLFEAVVDEIQKRSLVVSRPWAYSSDSDFTSRSNALNSEPKEHPYFGLYDLRCNRETYIVNYEKYVTSLEEIRPEVHKAFFGIQREGASRKASYYLAINECRATSAAFYFKSDVPTVDLTVLPEPMGLKELEQLDLGEDRASLLCADTSVCTPQFIRSRPLYLAMLKYIRQAVKDMHPDVEVPTFPVGSDDLKRKGFMVGMVSYGATCPPKRKSESKDD